MNRQKFEAVAAMLTGLEYALAVVIDKLSGEDPIKRQEMVDHLRVVANLFQAYTTCAGA
ncbi:hypothetical protein [Cupriavidus sp. 8B]